MKDVCLWGAGEVVVLVMLYVFYSKYDIHL